MNIENRPNVLDYSPCRYGSSRIPFRGPARRIKGDYIAFLGGVETFGLYTPVPYPNLVEQRSGLTAINLGCVSAGVDVYINSSGLIDICSMAKVTVIQIVGAMNMSNRLYTVDPRHNDHFLRASKRFKEIYPEVDFATFDLTSHMLTDLAFIGTDRLHLVRHELQTAWVARMRTLLHLIDGKKILLWMSDHAPYCSETGGTIYRDPMFVDRAMLDAIKDEADSLVEVVAEPGEVESGRKLLVYPPGDQAAASDMLGPLVHKRVAQELDPVISDFMKRDKQEEPPAPAPDQDRIANLFSV